MVRSRHVRQGQWPPPGCLPRFQILGSGLGGEDKIHGVFGQHCDQREESEGETRSDVQLDDLGGPDEDESGSDDAHSEEERGEDWVDVSVAQAEVDTREGDDEGHRHEGDLPCRV